MASIKDYATSFDELKKTVHIETEEEKRERRVTAYLENISDTIHRSYENGMSRVYIELNHNLYDSYQLKKDLKELGYNIELHREIDSYLMQKIPVRMTVVFNKEN